MVADRTGTSGSCRCYLAGLVLLIVSDGIGLVLNSWLSNLYRPARGRKRLSSLPIATSSVVAAEQEITGMKVTEVRTARSCASWLSHYRSRAKPGPILSSSSFFSFQWRVAAKFPHPATDPAQQESWPCTISPAPRYSATVHSPSPCPRRLIAHAQLAYRSRNLRSA